MLCRPMKRAVLSFVVGLLACPSGPPCPSGDCTPDGGPPDGGGGGCRVLGNLVYNPGFECGVEGWQAVDLVESGTVSESTEARSGARSGLLTATRDAASVSLWTKDDAVVNPGRRSFCARAWMKGTNPVGRLTLVKVKPGWKEEISFSMPVTGDWQIVPPPDTGPLLVTGENEDKILLRVWIPSAKAGDKLYVDDVQLWESPDGGCK